VGLLRTDKVGPLPEILAEATVPQDRLTAKDGKVLLLWILVGLLGAGVASRYFFVAFPEAAVDFRVSRPAAMDLARDFVTAQGQKLEGYQSSIVFRVDDNAKTYLEREVGLKQANELMASAVSVWYWGVRFFRPGQKEEFFVRVSPAGRIVGYKHVIEEAREGAHLEREAARATAEAFLATRYQADLAAYDFLPQEANSTERPRRRDWSFTWERRGFRAPAREGGAPYRLRVTVQGARVGESEEFLKVPEAWERDYQRLRSSNALYESIALVPYALLYGALFWVIFDLGRRGLIRWGGAVKLGLVLAALFFVTQANSWPLARASYDTNSSYPGFFFGKMVAAALLSLGLGLVVSLTLAAAEPLYRRNQPDQLRLGVAFSLPGIRSKEFFRSCVIGLAMAAGHIGFVVLFYIVGGKFGVWAPQDINYTNVVSTTLPWVYPLTIGVYAATSEEFLFRLFAIPFLLRFTASRLLAVVIPAFVWGFLHSNYPQEPGYIRGIEVGLIGIVAGVVMLRWGILATLVWHYTVDALLISLFLLRSGSLYFRVSGALVGAGVLIPLAIAGAFYVVRRRFEPDEALLNRAETLVEEVAAPPAAAAERGRGGYEALAPRTLGIVLACGVAGALLLIAVKAQTIGDFVRFRVNAREATARADGVLRQWKVNPATYHRVATFQPNFNGYTSEYLRRQLGIASANQLYGEKVPSAFWRVRYFRDSQKEEYAVILRTDGALHSVHHSLEEKAPGAKLTKEEAQGRAEAFLREEKKLDLAKWKLVEVQSEETPAHTRTDHTFTWEEIEPVGQPWAPGKDAAHVRVQLKVQGDEVSGYRVFVKIPEEWERRQSEQTLPLIVHKYGSGVFYAALGIAAVVIFFMNLKQQQVPWRRLARWSLWGLLTSAVNTINTLPIFLSRYPTEFPFGTYAAILVITMFLLVSVIYSALFFLFGLAWFFLSRAFDQERFPSWRGMPAVYYRDAFWLALGGTGALLGLSRLSFLLVRVWPAARRTAEANPPGTFDSLLPAAQAVAGAISGGLFRAGLVALVAGFVAGYVRRRWMQFGLVLLLALALIGDWGSPADFVQKVLVELAILGVVWWGIAKVVRFNLLAYFLITAAAGLATAAAELLRQPSPFFRANGYAVIAALLVLLAWPLASWLRGGESASALPSPGSGAPTG
jgi:membrane protease YdiL (CAAX protease family)